MHQLSPARWKSRLKSIVVFNSENSTNPDRSPNLPSIRAIIIAGPNLSSAFTVPVVTGDALTAIFAPVVAIVIGMRRGPRTWAAAIVWNVLGMTDLLYALALGSLTGAASYILANNILVLVGASLGIVLHGVSMILLLRKTGVDYFLNRV